MAAHLVASATISYERLGPEFAHEHHSVLASTLPETSHRRELLALAEQLYEERTTFWVDSSRLGSIITLCLLHYVGVIPWTHLKRHCRSAVARYGCSWHQQIHDPTVAQVWRVFDKVEYSQKVKSFI